MLEELVLSIGTIPGDLAKLSLPASLKTLYVEDHPGCYDKPRSEEAIRRCSNLLKGFVGQQRGVSHHSDLGLRGIAVVTVTWGENNPQPIYATVRPRTPLKLRGQNAPVEVDLVSKADFQKMFGNVNFPPKLEGLWGWVDICKDRW
ncbi:hypothetical protein ABW21_db0205244 [Orbilia brochopaga]|nr:hypothetical protein ABW21_db0205244 [Drechslerella brochopaga]